LTFCRLFDDKYVTTHNIIFFVEFTNAESFSTIQNITLLLQVVHRKKSLSVNLISVGENDTTPRIKHIDMYTYTYIYTYIYIHILTY